MNIQNPSQVVGSSTKWMPIALAMKAEMSSRCPSPVQLPAGTMPAYGWPVVLVVTTGAGRQLAAAQAILGGHLKRWGCAVLPLAANPTQGELSELMRSLHAAAGEELTVDPTRFGIAQLRDDGVALHAFNGAQAGDAFMEVDAASGAEELAMWMTENLW